MPAYSIALCNVSDPDKYQEYARLAGPAVAKYGGKFVARGGKVAVLEGKLDYSRVVIVEFADIEAAQKFWSSPEYQEARQKRLDAAEFNLIVVQVP